MTIRSSHCPSSRSSRFTRGAALAAALGAFAGATAYAEDAQACSATQQELYRSAKSVWCVEKSVIQKSGAFPTSFFAYSDAVVDQLVALFDVPAEGVYTFEASVPNGGAHTGSECCGLGVTVTGDAFYNNAYGATGFWGYLLSLHEMINDFTGQVSGGWPTDFWADHVSAFPNSMDWHIMATLGQKNNDQNLIKSSAAQKKRFYPGGDSVDPRVGMFDNIFDLPNYGFPGLSHVFAFVKKDKMSWDNLGVANPDVKRTEYVIAYLSLGAGKPVTSIMKAAHVGDGTADGAGDQGYNVNDAHIDAIANAHCAVVSAAAQGKSVTNDLKSLQKGNYTAVTVQGTCGTGCPSECGCISSKNVCVAKWLGDPSTGSDDAGATGGDDDGGVTPGDDDTGDDDSGTIGGGGGGKDGGNAGTDGGTTPGGNGAAGGGDAPQAGGCACRVGDAPGTGLWAMFAASALIMTAILRARATRR